VNFSTITGKAVLIAVKMADGGIPPMGAEVINSEGAVIGMVGQGGQVYARISTPSGSLLVRWEKGPIDVAMCPTSSIYIRLKT
jgi:outer membrane usher protein